MEFRFLIDENLRGAFSRAIQRSRHGFDVVRVGDIDALPIGALDPEILTWCAENQRILITSDRNTMGQHLTEYCQSHSSPLPGVFILRDGYRIPELIDFLALLVSASSPDEYQNCLTYIP